jgi:integrase
MATLNVNRQIRPALKRCAVCKVSKRKHDDDDHKYREQLWKGWHPFRRGLSTNLNSLGVPSPTIQKIMRHADASTTQKHYIKPTDADAVEGMAMLAKKVKGHLALGTSGAQTMDVSHDGVVH